MKERMTLNQYKEKIKFFWNHFAEKMLVDAANDEIYRVFNVCRPDVEGRIGTYGSLFRKIDSIRELIRRADENNISDYDEDIEEYIEETTYWVVDKYRLVGDEYEKLFSLTQVDEFGYLEVEFNFEFEKYASESEKEIYKEWLDIFELQFKDDLALPFKPGDILKLDNRPLSNEAEFFIVHKNQLVFKRDSWGDLSYGGILMAGEKGFVDFLPCHVEVIPSCPDPVLNKLSAIIREEGNEEKIKSIISRLFEKKNILERSKTAKAIEEEILTGKAKANEKFKERITLDEYKEIREKAGLTFMSVFSQTLEDDEVYFVKSHISGGVKNKTGKQEIFHCYEKIIEYIKEESPRLYTAWDNPEPYEDTVWWSVEKRKLIKDNYKTTMRCLLDCRGNMLEFLAGEAFYDGCHSDFRYAQLCKQLQIVDYRDEYGTIKLPTIDFPFEPGDILFADKRPIGDKREYIYLGGQNRKYRSVNYICLSRATFKEKDKFQITTLNALGDLFINGQPYFHLLEKRDSAKDEYINKAYKAIKKDSTIIQKIISIGKRNDFGDPDEIDICLNEVLDK